MTEVETAAGVGPRISVVIPTRDRPQLLRRAVESVLGQTLRDFELEVVDDGSSGDTAAALATYGDSRLRVHPRPHRGRSAARNFGAQEARAELLTFLDDDDEALPEWLEKLVAPFDELRTGVVCCGETIVLEDSKDRKTVERLPRNLGPLYEGSTGLFRSGTFALRRSLFTSIGGYAEELSYAENTELALRLTTECRTNVWQIAPVPEALVRVHRLREAGDSEAFQIRLESARYMLRRHGERYLARRPQSYANYCAIAGVNSARLGRHGEARRFFLAAIRAHPRLWRSYGRYLLSWLPPLSRRVWGFSSARLPTDD